MHEGNSIELVKRLNRLENQVSGLVHLLNISFALQQSLLHNQRGMYPAEQLQVLHDRIAAAQRALNTLKPL